MTTKQAALLAAVGTTIELLALSIWPFRFLEAPGAWHSQVLVLNVLSALLILPVIVIFAAALPVFFVCVYLNEPPLAVPERLRRPALVAAIAAGLYAGQTTFDQIRSSFNSWDMSGWIRVLEAIVVSLFFFTVSRSSPQQQAVNPRLKKAAMYAGAVIAAGAVMMIFTIVSVAISPWTQAALPAARGIPPGTELWHRLLEALLGSFRSFSLVWFFYQFYKTVPTAQSSQRLSSGE